MTGREDAIEIPETGERLTIRRTGRDTGGESLVVEGTVPPGQTRPAVHAHPGREERFQVLRGTVGYRIGRATGVARAGERLTVPSGALHRFWNAGPDEAQFVFELRPALDPAGLAAALTPPTRRRETR